MTEKAVLFTEGKKYPLVSVIIPTYNREKTITYCLNSVLSQTYKNFEVIIVDDCSTDNTAAMINSHPDSRVRCIVLEKNSGAQAARNRGIKEAKGDWIAFQDSDDEWLPNKLERQINVLSKAGFDPYTVVHSNAIKRDYTTKTKTIWKLPIVDGESEVVYPRLLTAPGPMFQSMLVSKAALEKINNLDVCVPAGQEWDTAIRLAKFCRFIHMRKPLFIYHLHKGATISNSLWNNFDGYQYIIEKHENEIKAQCGESVWVKHLSNQLTKLFQWEFMQEAKLFVDRYPVLKMYYDEIYDDFTKNKIIERLNNGLWEEASDMLNSYYGTHDLRLTVLKTCRYMHVRPRRLSGIKRMIQFLTNLKLKSNEHKETY